MATHVAEVHSAGVLADHVPFQKHHRAPALTQEECRSRAHKATAYDQYINLLNAHRDTSSASLISSLCIGSGLTGA
ncbi:hypothetical protein D3C80_1627350 [compost metagenome]